MGAQMSSTSSEKKSEAGRKGGEAEHSERGLEAANEQTRERVARAGGEAVSQDREHMSEIGRKGGEAVSRNREHMSQIGKKGGESRNKGER